MRRFPNLRHKYFSSQSPSFMKTLYLPLLLVAGLLRAETVQIKIDLDDTGRVFQGAGGVSAGASSRLLYDYPEPQRSEILDLLFKPHFGAHLQHLKVEIGNDANTTCGSEPSHARTPEELEDPVFTRGYEYWLMAEAKKRNPDLIVNALQWGTPAYTGGHWTAANAEYIIQFIEGARKQWGVRMDYISPGRNEDAMNYDWLQHVFKPMLDEAGYADVKILGIDDNSEHWEIFEHKRGDADFWSMVDAVGYHYIDRPERAATQQAIESGVDLWASEDWSRTGSWEDAWYLALILNRFYIRDRVTMTSVWPPIDAMYNVDNHPHIDKGLTSADEPWSGHYQVEPPIWIMAHTNQFAQIGWQYLDGACGNLPIGGNYVTLKSPNEDELSVIIVNRASKQTIEIELPEAFGSRTIYGRKSDSDVRFVALPKRDLDDGTLRITCAPDSVYSISTLDASHKGETEIPESRMLGLPYRDDFENEELNRPGRYFSDMEGAFEIGLFEGQKRLKQALGDRPWDWVYDHLYEPAHPITVMGDLRWRDYTLSCRVLIPEKGHAGIHIRVAGDVADRKHGISLQINHAGTWALKKHHGGIAYGTFDYQPGQWVDLELSGAGDVFTARINGDRVATRRVETSGNGRIALSSSYDVVWFDDLRIQD